MKHGLWILIAGVLLLGGVATWGVERLLQPPLAQAAVPDPVRQQSATKFIDLLDAGKFDEALAMGTPALRQALAEGKLQQVWEALPIQLGARQSRGKPRAEMIHGSPAVSSRLQFGMMALDARVVFDTNNVISGFWIVPASSESAETTAKGKSTHNERGRVISKESVALPATLTLPDGKPPFAAVVLVHDSGPHDRDETIGPNKPFLDLADGLAERGIAVLRFEKRTLAHPDLFAHGGFTVDEETVDDAPAAAVPFATNSGRSGGSGIG